ncbi:hypothetical protein [Tropicimonas sp. IMCC34043]|uniref:hypothetical protein n=1 Tax=Tropicimonas sp. IMCC34043 TaxID=2248760 RepID=UPI0013002C36|nr:hypothetical protein [Tropicimonas sp. IMCC34043]
MKTLLYLYLPLALALAACSGDKTDTPMQVTSRAATATHDCVEQRLGRLPVRTLSQMTGDGWRIDVQVYGTPPAGWYRKGTIEHSHGLVFFLPDSASDGIGLREIEDRIDPILRRCAGH